MNRLLRPGRGLLRIIHLAIATGTVFGGGALAGCGSVVSLPETRPDPTTIVPFATSSVDKVDLLLMIDNSRSMADKQQILAFAVPDLVRALVNPKCVNATGLPTATQPSEPLASCPSGAHRAIVAILDIHIGIITSSLGGHGADSCSVAGDTQSCPGGPNPSNNDAGHLVTRQKVCGVAAIPTYGSRGFLAWDPAQQLSPPGEGQLGSLAVDGLGNPTTVQAGTVDASGSSAWDRILGDPRSHTPPKDQHMIESVAPRAGLPGPTSAPDADPINGHEYTTNDDLQYACIFDLPAARDCSVVGASGCDCSPGSDSPLCDPSKATTQLRAKAYPALRELATLKSLGSQGIVASVCRVQITDTNLDDYGYPERSADRTRGQGRRRVGQRLVLRRSRAQRAVEPGDRQGLPREHQADPPLRGRYPGRQRLHPVHGLHGRMTAAADRLARESAGHAATPGAIQPPGPDRRAITHA